jgi:hypothetical protein
MNGSGVRVSNLRPASRLIPSQATGSQPAQAAIIGLGCRFPGDASDPDKFWALLDQGIDAIQPVPSDRWNAAAYSATIASPNGGFIRDVESFDASFFHITPRDANVMDPQHRSPFVPLHSPTDPYQDHA